jgi:hypothetical protein
MREGRVGFAEPSTENSIGIVSGIGSAQAGYEHRLALSVLRYQTIGL